LVFDSCVKQKQIDFTDKLYATYEVVKANEVWCGLRINQICAMM